MGLDVPGVAGIGLDLLAQRGHKHPQGGGVGGQGAAPDLVENVVVGEHLAGVLGQQAQQLVLDGGQVNLLPVLVGAAGGVVDFQPPFW